MFIDRFFQMLHILEPMLVKGQMWTLWAMLMCCLAL